MAVGIRAVTVTDWIVALVALFALLLSWTRSTGSSLSRGAAWSELTLAHERFVEDYNAQSHFAHRERDDGRRSPPCVPVEARGSWRWPRCSVSMVPTKSAR